MTWNDLWGWFKEHVELQEEILRQLDLERWLKTRSVAVQVEVLQFAPSEVQLDVKHALHVKAMQKLGLAPDFRSFKSLGRI